uniref:Retrovirus-related Pol polyprotein from transposon TNT 1-94 n=1 Tax=Cajanus cajan TaxID=3821 RepID=A0A151T1B1_CAJCA|nr:Retrovirus-related Pol polyprotein from transposon TNT 1-94 [Cajanus cajan]
MADGNSFLSIPKFDGDYDHWSMLMENLLRSKEYWSVVEQGYEEPKILESLTGAERKTLETQKLNDLRAKNYLFQSIDKNILKTITNKATSKALWDSMKQKYQGNARVQRAQLQRLRREFEILEMQNGECVNDYISRVMIIANDMRGAGEAMEDGHIVEKILRTLSDKYNYIVCSIEESKDINEMMVDELQSSLLIHEHKIKRQEMTEQALKVTGDYSAPRVTEHLIECYRCRKLGHFQYECPTYANYAEDTELDDEQEMLLMSYVEMQGDKRDEIWFLDSGCSNHMSGDRKWFTELDQSFRHSVKLGNDFKLNVMGKGNVRMKLGGRTVTITEVFYTPDLKSNLLSIGQLQERNLSILIKNGCCSIYHDTEGLIIRTTISANRMFVLTASIPVVDTNISKAACLNVTSENITSLWHQRFGHLNMKGLRTLAYRKMVQGLPILKNQFKLCTICMTGKQQRHSFPQKSTWRASKPLQLIHSDICGPITPESHSHKRYILTFIDDYSRKMWSYFLHAKSEAFDTFKRFKSLIEKATGYYITCLRTDRGGEFTSSEFNDYCSSNGITRQLTTPYSPQQNGVAERRNRTLMNMVRCMLTARDVPKEYWPEAANLATHILNRCPTSVLPNMTPEEAWKERKPSVTHLKVFGCIGYVHVPDVTRKKLDEKSIKCVYVGVSEESKAFRMYNPETKKIIISRDVVFDEMEKWDWKKSEGANSLELMCEEKN